MKTLYRYILAVLLATLVVSCTKRSYRDALPANPIALMSVDVNEAGGVGDSSLLASLVNVDDAAGSALSPDERIYFFETADGNLGLCASVNHADKLVEAFSALHTQKRASAVDTADDVFSCSLDDAWAVAFDDHAMLIAGPAAAAELPALRSRLTRYLKQDAERSGASSALMQRVDSIQAPMALAAQQQALPEQLAMPFLLGAPRQAEPSQVLLSAAMHKEDGGTLLVDATTFSFNKKLQAALDSADNVFRPLNLRYLPMLGKDAAMALYVNVDGQRFLPLVQQNAAMQPLLAGVNAAIDMNSIIKSIDGELAVVMPSLTSSKLLCSMAAELAHSQWIADVGYWKTSAPRGTTFSTWGTDGYCFTGSDGAFFFGVKKGGGVGEEKAPSLQFYGGTTSELARAAITETPNELQSTVGKHLKGARLGLVAQLSGLTADEGLAKVLPVVKTLLGNANTIIIRKQ